MRIITLTAAALMAVSGTAFAGGFDDEIIIPIPAPLPVEPAPTGSLGSLGGLGGTAAVLAPLALIAVLAASEDDDDEDDATPDSE